MTNVSASKDKWFENFARFGLVSKGIVYCLIGVLTLLAALGLGGEKANKEKAFEVVYDQPFGKILLVLIIIGLLGYVTLRVLQCVKDIDNKGGNLKGIAIRVGYGISALIYLSMGVYAAKLLIEGHKSDGNSKQFLISKALEYSAGQWLIIIVGLIIIGIGIQQVYKALSGKFMKRIQLIQSAAVEMFKKAGMLGYLSRGIVLIIFGYLLFHAALIVNPKEAKGGTDAAFDFLENQFGGFLMGIVALGLVGYGVFMFVRARYQRINIEL